MKAVLVTKPFEISIVDIPKPVIKENTDVLIKVIAGGICGSDVAIFNGTNSLATYPRIIGHEFCGRVVEVGSDVTNVSIGDIVAVDPVNSCGKCDACTGGHHNVCEFLEVSGVHRDGGFSEYYLSKEDNCHVLRFYNDEAEAALVEPYSIGSEINHQARINNKDFVVVMGSGPIGITAMQIAKSRGAVVLMTDLLESRLIRAKKMGADFVLNVSQNNLAENILSYCQRKPSVIVDTVCSVSSPVEAMKLAAPAGRVVILGTRKDPSEIPQVLFTMKELEVIGSRLSNNRFPEVINFFEENKGINSDLVTHSFNFEQVADAINTVIEHPEEVCKVQLKF
ncbi:MAG TPA: zinc-binding alcohol dehydrogenase family protein [Clostridiaceae bacterium]|nr:zinc-binding alcohol dehydrogenase family protein [Clostridiaceae bacterium]